MHDVFISYSRKQLDQVSAVAQALEQRGVPVWMDRADIPQGVPWEQQLRRAIRESDLVAYFVSDEWLESATCASERDIASEYSKTIFPVRMLDQSFDAAEAAAAIEQAYDQLPRYCGEATDLEAAAAAWAETGSKRKHLARGVNLKRFRAIAKLQIALSDTAQRFVAASKRANRLRRVDAILGVLIISLGGLFFRAVPAAIDNVNDARVRLVTNLAEYSRVNNASAAGPYTALSVALDLPSDDPKRVASHDYVSTMLNATSVDVPVDKGAASDPRLSAFAFAACQTQALSPTLSLKASFEPGQPRVALWNTTGDAEALLAEVTVPGRALALAFSPDGYTLAVLSDQAVTLIDPIRGSVWRTLTGAKWSSPNKLVWSPDGRQVAVLDDADQTVTVWQVLSETQVLGRTGLWIMDSTTLGDTGKAAFLGRDGSIAIADPKGVEVLDKALPSGVAVGLAADSKGQTVYAIVGLAGQPNQLHTLDLETKQTTRVGLPADCSPTVLALNPTDDTKIYLACSPRIVVVQPDGTVLADVQTGIGGITALAVAANGTVVAGALGGGGLIPFTADLVEQAIDGSSVLGTDAATGTCPGGTPLRIRFHPDGWRAYGTGEGTGFNGCARVIERKDQGRWILATPPVGAASASQSRGLALSPSGELAAIGLSDGSVQVIRASNSALGWRWGEQYGEVRGLEFTADSQSIMIGTRDGLITMVPTRADRLDGAALRELAQQMLDHARDLGLYSE